MIRQVAKLVMLDWLQKEKLPAARPAMAVLTMMWQFAIQKMKKPGLEWQRKITQLMGWWKLEQFLQVSLLSQIKMWVG